MKNQRVFFTLIELLVVISILVLLMGLLLPMLSKSKAKSKAIMCMSNQRQIAQTFLYYANDYGGNMVAGRMYQKQAFDVGNGFKWRPRWYAQIGISGKFYAFSSPSPLEADDNSQLVDNKAYLCPEEPLMDNGRNYGYGYNFQFLGNSRQNKSKTDYINWPKKIDSIKKTSGTIIFADAMGTAAGKPLSSRLPYDDISKTGGSNVNKIGNHAWSLDPPRLITGSSDFCDDNNRSPEHRSAVYPRHLNRANVAFIDGHVESKSLTDIRYEVLADGTIGVNGKNDFFSGSGIDENPPDIN